MSGLVPFPSPPSAPPVLVPWDDECENCGFPMSDDEEECSACSWSIWEDLDDGDDREPDAADLDW